jgi:hypothetical protein
MRERFAEQVDLEDMRARIRAFRNDLYKYKSTYSRSPIKRPNLLGDPTLSPFKQPGPPSPMKRYEEQAFNFNNIKLFSFVVFHPFQLMNGLVLLLQR